MGEIRGVGRSGLSASGPRGDDPRSGIGTREDPDGRGSGSGLTVPPVSVDLVLQVEERVGEACQFGTPVVGFGEGNEHELGESDVDELDQPGP